ncbi:MAG: Hsp70 family protein, partial [Myxococcota bacterium]|nr:Hsp70 family protein [Myxococcota bacterium]
MSDAPRRGVGIDLGTTNCALAHVAMGGDGSVDEQPVPGSLDIPQVIQPGEVTPAPLLPSFLYLAGEHELPAGSLDLPWSPGRDHAVGRFAREHGAKVPGRLVSSAKSWLCHSGVSRRDPILPYKAPDEVAKLSPVEVSSRYLEHLAAAWRNGQGSALGDEQTVLTVPASFDAAARDLTVEAAAAAGIPRPVLLEEPQAALYAWIAGTRGAWRKQVSVGDVILVVDVGGGTTDLSLIAVSEEGGDLALTRVAVGEHILLGGDNMDLALAHQARVELAQAGTRLDGWQFLELGHACRLAKERLLADP